MNQNKPYPALNHPKAVPRRLAGVMVATLALTMVPNAHTHALANHACNRTGQSPRKTSGANRAAMSADPRIIFKR